MGNDQSWMNRSDEEQIKYLARLLAELEERIEELEAETLAHPPEVAALIEAAVLLEPWLREAREDAGDALGHARKRGFKGNDDTYKLLHLMILRIQPFLPKPKTRLELLEELYAAVGRMPKENAPIEVVDAHAAVEAAAAAGEGE